MNFIFKWKENNEKNIKDVFLSKGLICRSNLLILLILFFLLLYNIYIIFLSLRIMRKK